MNFEISVYRDKNLLFSTSSESLANRSEEYVVQLAEEFRMKFPECKVELCSVKFKNKMEW